jgi:MtaA/CmuA family methyltransferase
VHPRERMRRALNGEPTDRPAVAYQFLGGARHVLGRMGSRMATVYRNADRIAQAQVVAAELFGHDACMVPWGCLTVEAEAFGCGLEWPADFYPRVVQRPLEDARDLSRLHDPDPSRSGRMPLVLEAITRLRERAGDDLFIVGMVVSPFLVAAEIRGMTELLEDFVLDPQFAQALLDRVADGTSRYVEAIVDTGACDAVMFENAGACAEIMGPHHLERYVMPYERRLLGAARRRAPEVALIEHNCSTTPYFGDILTLDIDAVSFAYGDVHRIADRYAWDCNATHTSTNACLDRFCLRSDRDRQIARIGNVDNTRIMLEATSEQVEREARACIESAQGSPFVLSTSCEIPFTAPTENIEALAAAARGGR